MRQMINRVIFQVPADVLRGLTGFVKDTIAHWEHNPKHFVLHKKGTGLGKLFRYQRIEMKTLYERRSKLKEGGQVLISALFRYNGKKIFIGDNGVTVRSGDTVSVKFHLGKNQDDFYVQDYTQNMLPDQFHIHWHKKDGHGTITSTSVIPEA